MVECRGVSKVYRRPGGGRVEALADLSLRVEPGELAVLVGPTGAGKSTLLRLITGEERPSRGAVLVDGVEIGSANGRALARVRRALGVVPQPGVLLPDRTALENITFVLRALGARRVEARARAREALVEAGLAAARHARPGELSEGERRQLLLARALAPRPRLLVADEPAALLEPAARAHVVSMVRAAHARGTTCLVTTQALDLAGALAGRCLPLSAGRLAPGGSPG